MKRIFCPLVCLLGLLSFAGQAASHTTSTVTISIQVTDQPAAGDILYLNTTDVRTWRTTSTLSDYVLNRTTLGVNTNATNLYICLSTYPTYGPTTAGMTAADTVTLIGVPGQALTASASGRWCTITAATNTAYWSTPGGTNDFFPMASDDQLTVLKRTAQSTATLVSSGISVTGGSGSTSTNIDANIARVGGMAVVATTDVNITNSTANPVIVSNVVSSSIGEITSATITNELRNIVSLQNSISNLWYHITNGVAMNVAIVSGGAGNGEVTSATITNELRNANALHNSQSNSLLNLGALQNSISNSLLNANALANSISNSALNKIALLNSISNQLYAITNQTAAIKTYITNATEYDNHPTNAAASPLFTQATSGTNSVGGFTLVTNLTITNYLGTDLVAGDILNTNAIQISPVARTANNGTAVLLGATYCSSTNLVLQAVDMLICSQPVTWGNASAVPGIVNAELPYILGVLSFGTNAVDASVATPFIPFGTVQVCTKTGLNIGLRPATNTIFLYFRTRVAITNGANDVIKLSISQD
jgi:hypothetical protein